MWDHLGDLAINLWVKWSSFNLTVKTDLGHIHNPKSGGFDSIEDLMGQFAFTSPFVYQILILDEIIHWGDFGGAFQKPSTEEVMKNSEGDTVIIMCHFLFLLCSMV